MRDRESGSNNVNLNATDSKLASANATAHTMQDTNMEGGDMDESEEDSDDSIDEKTGYSIQTVLGGLLSIAIIAWVTIITVSST